MSSNQDRILIVDDDQILVDSIHHYAQVNTNGNLARYEIIGLSSKDDLDSFFKTEGDDRVHIVFVDMMIDDDMKAGIAIADLLENKKIYFAFLSAKSPVEIENSFSKKYKYLLQVIRKSEVKSLVVQMSSLAATTYKLIRKDQLLDRQKRKGMVIGVLMLLCNLNRKEAEKLAHKLAIKANSKKKNANDLNEYAIVFNHLMKSDLKSIRGLCLNERDDEHLL